MRYQPSYIRRSPWGVYQLRLRIPARHRTIITQREFRRSLHTRDWATALARAGQWLAWIRDQQEDWYHLAKDALRAARSARRSDWTVVVEERLDGTRATTVTADPSVPGDSEGARECVRELRSQPAHAPSGPPQLSVVPEPELTGEAAETISALLQSVAQRLRRDGTWGPTTERERLPHVSLFVELLGDLPVGAVKRGQAGRDR